MKKILIVEDNLKIAAALSVRLKHAGYDVLTAADGLQGLKVAVVAKPDLIVSADRLFNQRPAHQSWFGGRAGHLHHGEQEAGP
jgi:response regulator RpfG family c-di-GMP phosphodiesterase